MLDYLRYGQLGINKEQVEKIHQEVRTLLASSQLKGDWEEYKGSGFDARDFENQTLGFALTYIPDGKTKKISLSFFEGDNLNQTYLCNSSSELIGHIRKTLPKLESHPRKSGELEKIVA